MIILVSVSSHSGRTGEDEVIKVSVRVLDLHFILLCRWLQIVLADYLPFWFSKNKRWLEFLLPNCYKEKKVSILFLSGYAAHTHYETVMPRSIQPITLNVINELDWIDEWNHRHVALCLAVYYTELWMNINNTDMLATIRFANCFVLFFGNCSVSC